MASGRRLRYVDQVRGFAIVVGLVMACSSTDKAPQQQPEPTLQNTAANDDDSPTRPAPALRCLPVVAAECGCVYDCGVGEPQSDGSYLVTHSFWEGTRLEARVAQWCSGSDCTDAFHAEIVCDGICAPMPADPTCHFMGDKCSSLRK